jgi:flagellar biosynthesis protein FliR
MIEPGQVAALGGPAVTIGGGQTAALALVLARTTGFVVSAPIVGHRHVPALVKAGLSAVLAVALVNRAAVAPGALPLGLALPLEIAIGLAFGMILALSFTALEVVGRLVSLQMGLSLGSVLGPNDIEGGTGLDPFFSVLTGLVFLALNLHLALVAVLAHSFQALPIGGGWPDGLASLGVGAITIAIELGVKLALPLALSLLLVELAVALVSRAIPQINVFMMGLPLKLLVGLMALSAATPELVRGTGQVFGTLFGIATTGALP